MNLSTTINPIQNFIKSFFALFAIMRIFSIPTNHFLSLILFIGIYILIQALEQQKQTSKLEKGDFIFSWIIGSLFTIFTISAEYKTLLGDLTSTLFCCAILLLSTLGFWIIFSSFVLFMLLFFGNITITNTLYAHGKLPVITFFACLLAWLPYFLYNFPGVMTPDSINQYAQIIGIYAQSNHHPWIHTQLIRLLYNIGMLLTNNAIVAISFYTVFQMCFLAFAASYTVRTLQKTNVKTTICVVIICFYALVPYHGAFAVTIWKDVMFAGAFTIFTCSLLRFLVMNQETESNGSKLSLYILYFLSGFMVCLFRTNGWYVFLVTVPFSIFIIKKQWRSMVFLNIAVIAVVLVVKIPIMNIYGIIQPDFAESLSIPAQQIARVYATGHTGTPEQTTALDQILDTSQLATAYQEDVYDNVKYLLRAGDQAYLQEHKSEYLKLWISLGMQYPKEYFDAFVAQTKGYWYPNVSYEVGLNEGIYENDFGLSWTPILKGNIMIKLKEIIFKLWTMIPLYGLLWSMGSLFWLLFIGIALSCKKRHAPCVLLYLPALFLIATLCLATPVAAEFRYVYSLFFALPIYISAPFIKSDAHISNERNK